MGGYIPVTADEQEKMLQVVGLNDVDALFADVPDDIRLKEIPDLDKGLSELEVQRQVTALAEQNKTYDVVLRGAGTYRHHIPAAVGLIAGKEEFVTAYTPYQAEISQGILQGIFEYQTMISDLTTMHASNASVYDGATAAGEAMSMCRERKAIKMLIAENANPMTKEVMATYAYGVDAPIEFIPEKDGRVDLDALKEMVAEDVCGVYIEQPNYYGLLEDVTAIAEIAHAGKAKLVLGANPMALAIYKSPAACGVDIVVGDGQPLGIPMNYGGPSVGFMACTEKWVRRLPGRIVGQTTDLDGKRAFVLTMQAREQHIRREKASSNICSNQALCALTTGIYMTVMGPKGLKKAAMQSMAKAHYLADQLAEIGFKRVHDGEFFHEFVTTAPGGAAKAETILAQENILAGLPLDDDRILWCATELCSKEDLDRAVTLLKEGLA